MTGLSTLRGDARRLFDRGVDAANPRTIAASRLRLVTEGLAYSERVCLSRPDRGGHWVIVGAGKAAANLAAAVEESLGREAISGRVIVKDGHCTALRSIVCEEASHPVPDQRGQAATSRLLEDLQRVSPADRVILLLTGGASSLLVAPAQGVSLEEKVTTTRLLLASGADIHEMNAVRKHLSAVKGGRLLARLPEGRSVALVVSDVVGDDLSSIGSGPAVPDPTTFENCWEILSRLQLLDRLPERVRERIAAGRAGSLEETPKPTGDTPTGVPEHFILASNRQSTDAVCDMARELGYRPVVHGTGMTGNVHEVATAFSARLRELSGERTALIAGGELTLQVEGDGVGGRSQEFALVAAKALRGAQGVVLLAAGSDGTDGPTDAAGAIVDGETWDRSRSLGLAPDDILANNDSYRLFDALADLVKTGPTGTNVMDLMIGLTE